MDYQVLCSLTLLDTEPPPVDATVEPAYHLDAHRGARRWRGRDDLPQLLSGAWRDGDHDVSFSHGVRACRP